MSDLLKQAIADAKAVRATALSNAKAALEEHFAPKLQSMLSEKLAAEIAEEETAPEVHADAAQDAAALAATAPEAAPAPEAAADAAPVAEEEIEEYQTLGSGNPDPVEKSLALEAKKASSNYKAKTKGHKTEDKGQEVVDATKLSTAGEPKAVADSTKASPDYTKVTAGHKTQDPQGASNEVVKLEESDEITEESLDEILKELEASVNEVGGMEEVAAPMEAAAPDAEQVDEEIDLNELLSEEKEEGEKEEGEKEEKEETNESLVNENLSLKKEIEEYRSGIEFLRNQINEINLLNAKLLYTNKLFKGANLTNEQKLKVIESFDLTKSVREAKLVYATLAESINSGAKKVETPVKKSSTVKNITEGLASKPVASTKPTTSAVLTEGAEMANRFKKLAGIRSK